MSLGYLTDLVATTHVFLKLMEHMAKNKHLVVSKKTKVRFRKLKIRFPKLKLQVRKATGKKVAKSGGQV
jgi:hypothetical protein